MRLFKTVAQISLVACFLIAGNSANSAPPGTVPPLLMIIQNLYKPYLSGNDPMKVSAANDAIAPYASARLKSLIAKANAYETHTGDTSDPDFDVIIDGQDLTILKLPKLTVDQTTANTIVIKSRFLNDGDPTEVDYIFRRFSNKWLIDDIYGTLDKERWDFAAMLSQN